MTVHYRRDIKPVGNAWSETRVRRPAIVVRDPLPADAPEATLIQRNHPVQALAPNRADHPFAERVRLRRSRRRLEDRQTHRRHGAIDALGVDAVAIMNEASMRLIA